MAYKEKGAAAAAPNCSNANGDNRKPRKDTPKKHRYQKPESIKILEAKAQAAKVARHPNFPAAYIPKQTYRDDTSNGLTRSIVDWLRLEGWQAERVNSVGSVRKINGEMRWTPTNGQRGTADISATIQGRSVKIEVKCKATGDRYQSEDQKAYQREVETAGGVYIIAKEFTGFMEWYYQFTGR